METVTLHSLVGEHELFGVDIGEENFGYTGKRGYAVVGLSGYCYKFVENPDDGYRSYMVDEIVKYVGAPVNNFAPVKVYVRYVEERVECAVHEECEILEFVDSVTDKVVLTVGTGATDDYYPYCVFEYIPENMIHNVGL